MLKSTREWIAFVSCFISNVINKEGKNNTREAVYTFVFDKLV